MARVSGLYRVGLRVSDLDESAAFYRDAWSMELVGSDAGHRAFRSRGADHTDLVLTPGEPGLEHVAFSVVSEAALDELLGKLEGSIVQRRRTDGGPNAAPTAVITDLDGTRIELVVRGAPEKTDAGPAGVSGPRLGHIVLWTPQIERQEAFYALLGLKVSDRTQIGMSFLRCNSDHHSLALVRSTHGKTGLQHIAYDVGSLDQVMREYGRLRDGGVDCIWGVGRHGPGNNVFSYYRDPDGNVVEYYGDMEQVEDHDVGEPRFWGPEHKGDIWGVAGPPPQVFRD